MTAQDWMMALWRRINFYFSDLVLLVSVEARPLLLLAWRHNLRVRGELMMQASVLQYKINHTLQYPDLRGPGGYVPAQEAKARSISRQALFIKTMSEIVFDA